MNNATYFSWFETLRLSFVVHERLAYFSAEAPVVVLKSTAIDYRRPLFLDQDYVVAGRVREGVGRTEGEAKAAFEALQARMVDDPVGSYPRPMLLGQLGYLSGMIGRADQKPGADAYVRHQQLIDELDDIERELARLERLIA